MNHLFVTSTLAMLAKDFGFNEPCYKHWSASSPNWLHDMSPDVMFIYTNSWYIKLEEECPKTHKGCTVPMYQQLSDWFRTEKKLFINIYQNGDSDDEYLFRIYDTKYPHANRSTGSECVDTSYYGCYTKALHEAFKILEHENLIQSTNLSGFTDIQKNSLRLLAEYVKNTPTEEISNRIKELEINNPDMGNCHICNLGYSKCKCNEKTI